MASIKNILFLFTILISSTVTLAQGTKELKDPKSDGVSPNPPHGHGHGKGSDEETPKSSSAPELFDDIAFKAPEFHVSKTFEPELFGFRQKRTIDIRMISCNYAADGLTSCANCNTVRHCTLLNLGTERSCSRFLLYCNNGHCSLVKSAQCSATPAPSTSTTSAPSTSSTTPLLNWSG